MFWVLLAVLWIALAALVVFLLVMLVPRARPNGGAAGARPQTGAGEPPEQIVDRLFATGEIDEPTYRARRAALAQVRGPQ